MGIENGNQAQQVTLCITDPVRTYDAYRKTEQTPVLTGIEGVAWDLKITSMCTFGKGYKSCGIHARTTVIRCYLHVR